MGGREKLVEIRRIIYNTWMVDPMTSSNRIPYLDNLRVFAVFSVVFHHCSIPYAPDIVAARWHIVPDAVKHPIFQWVLEYIDLYHMPLLFFVAGYFAVLGLEKRSGKAFLLGKAERLLLPCLICLFTLVPILQVVYHYSRISTGLIGPDIGMPGVDFYIYGLGAGIWHLWFLLLLFYFCVLLLPLRKLTDKLSRRPFGLVCILIWVLSALFHFAVEAFYHRPSVWFSYPLITVQTERLALYFGIFLLGATFQKRQALKTADEQHTGKRWMAVCLPAFTAFCLVRHFAYDSIPRDQTPFFLLHSTVATARTFSAVFLFLFVFRSVLNWTSGFQAMLSRNSYGVYIIHYLLMAVAFIAIQSVKPVAPGPFVQFSVIFALTFLLSNAAVQIGRKI